MKFLFESWKAWRNGNNKLVLEIRAKQVRANFVAKYPNQQEEINTFCDVLLQKMPSGHKYFQYALAKFAEMGFSNGDFIIDTIQKFDTNKAVLAAPDNDIQQWQASSVRTLWDKLQGTIQKMQKKVAARQQVLQSETHYLQKTDKYYVLMPLSRKSASFWGKGTKWCISMLDQEHFTLYTLDRDFFIIYVNRQPNNDNYDKVALRCNVERETVEDVWLANDEEVEFESLPENVQHILNHYQDVKEVVDSESFELDELYVRTVQFQANEDINQRLLPEIQNELPYNSELSYHTEYTSGIFTYSQPQSSTIQELDHGTWRKLDDEQREALEDIEYLVSDTLELSQDHISFDIVFEYADDWSYDFLYSTIRRNLETLVYVMKRAEFK